MLETPITNYLCNSVQHRKQPCNKGRRNMNNPEEITKTIRIDFADYNTLTLLAKKYNFLDAKTGKMSARHVVHFLINLYNEVQK
jgi:hypothetical protein